MNIFLLYVHCARYRYARACLWRKQRLYERFLRRQRGPRTPATEEHTACVTSSRLPFSCTTPVAVARAVYDPLLSIQPCVKIGFLTWATATHSDRYRSVVPSIRLFVQLPSITMQTMLPYTT